tara:strand:- start:20 stop:955 length:936 start_codon:yes stop_codon:yes gene_type:complete
MASVVHPTFDRPQEEVVRPVDQNPEMGDMQTSPWSKDDTQNLDQSMDYGITTPLKNSLILKDQRNPDQKIDNKGVSLRAGEGGHELHLDNSSKTSGVKLHSKGQGAFLNMTADEAADPALGPAGAKLKARRNLTLHSDEGNLNATIADGGNITIKNNSTTSHAGGPFPEDQSGSVKIKAVNGDIHISCEGNGIFIDALGSEKLDGTTGASVQIRSKNKIALFSENGIDLKSAADINIKGRNVNLQSETALGGRVNLNPTTSLDPFMGIRKTKMEIGIERWSPAQIFPFFFNPIFNVNYVQGPNRNTGGPLL